MLPVPSAGFLAQSAATGALDSMIGGLNITPTQLAVFTLAFAILVILMVLGKEFWLNLYGLCTVPSVAFSRLMGEQQLLPAVFLVLMSGLGIAIFALRIMPTQQYLDVAQDQWAQMFAQLSDMYESAGVPYASQAMRFELDDVRLSVMKALGFFLLIPLTNVIWWYSLGVGYIVAGKLIGMRNAAGVNNVVCGLAWPMLLEPFKFWAESQARFFGHNAAWVLWGLLMLVQVLWILILSRELFRVGWVPTIIGILLAFILGGLVFAVAFTVLVILFGVLKENLPQYF